MSTERVVGSVMLGALLTGVLLSIAADGHLGGMLQRGAKYVQRGFDGYS